MDTSQRFQSILGFGAAFTDGSCYTLSQMPVNGRQSLMRELFSPAEMNLSVGRCCVGASAYSRDLISYDDAAGASPPRMTMRTSCRFCAKRVRCSRRSFC